jgi:hypothetical protein
MTNIKINGKIINSKSIQIERFDIDKESKTLESLSMDISKSTEALSIISNVKAMEAFGYQTTEGFGDKLKSGIKVVWNKIKEFFSAIGQFITRLFKWILSKLSRGKVKKETSEIIEKAVSESKSTNEIVTLVKTKVEKVVLEKDQIYNEEPFREATEDKPEDKTLREKHEAYDNIYNMYSKKLGDGSVGYSEAFTKFAINKWAIEFISGKAQYMNIGNENKSMTDLFSHLDGINIYLKSYFEDTKGKNGNESLRLARESIIKHIGYISEAKTRMEKIETDRYSEIKKLYLHDICIPGGLEKELNYAKQLKSEYDSLFNEIEPFTNEMMDSSSSVVFSNYITKVLTPLGKMFENMITSLGMIAKLVAITDQTIAAILYGNGKSNTSNIDVKDAPLAIDSKTSK